MDYLYCIIDKSVLTALQQAMTPITPLEPSEMFQRGKSQSFLMPGVSARTSLERPLSAYTDIEDVEDDDSSDFEEYSLGSSVRLTFIAPPIV